jgi:hypothetical protein
MKSGDLSERELEVLHATGEHQQHSTGQPTHFAGLGVHMRRGEPKTHEDLEMELIALLASLEQKGYLRRVGETEVAAKWPLYEVTQSGFEAVERT